MRAIRIDLAMLIMAAGCLPCSLVAQMDPSMNPGMNSGMPGNSGNAGMPNAVRNGSSTATTPQPASMRDSLGAPGDTGQQMQDKQFLRAAAEGGIAEVQLGTLAVAKGGPEVKELGQKMIDDHSRMDNELKAVADANGVMLPKKMKKEDQAEYDKLNALSGDDFDKEYLLYMVKDHREDLRAFRMESTVAVDQGLQAEAAKGAAVIREHLMMVTKLAQAKGVQLPPRPPRPGEMPPPPPPPPPGN